MVGLLLGGGLRLVLIGGAIGLALAALAGRLLTGLLFEVSGFDLVAFLDRGGGPRRSGDLRRVAAGAARGADLAGAGVASRMTLGPS